VTAAGGCNAIGCHDGADLIIDVHLGNCTNCHTNPAGGDYSMKAGSSAENHGHLDPGFGNPNTCNTCHGDYFYNHLDPVTKHFNAQTVQLHAECGQCHPDPATTLVDNVDTKVHNGCISCHNADGSLRSVAVNHRVPEDGANNDCKTCHGEYFSLHTHGNTHTVSIDHKN